MNYLKFTLLFLYVALNTNAQTNYCAQHKAIVYKKKLAITKSKKQNVTNYVPPESSYDLKFYHLSINVERNTLFVSGNVKSLAKVVVPSLDSFAFVLHQNHTIDSVYINGLKQNFVRRDSLVKASAGIPILQNQLFEAIVYYRGICPSNNTAAIGDGYNYDQSLSWGNEVTWSLSESFAAYQWFPCKQDLRDKIDSSWVFATTDSLNMVGSNGLLKNTVIVGNKKRYEWKSNYPIDYYLISVSTAKYKPYNLYAKPQALAGDSLLIQNFIYDNAINNSQWATQKNALKKIVPTLELLSKLYGLYPFHKEKYGHCMAPLGGGMEHQTMTTLGFFEFELDAHELGHQWWGDNVTCAAWKDIFINEGWASYTEYLCHQYLFPLSGVSSVTKMNNVHANVMSQTGGSCYFTNADTVNSVRIFDSRLTYDKGSAIIHTLRYVINNDSVFFPAIRGFQTMYSDSTASVIDFKNYMQTFIGINLTQFFNQWYYGQGYPIFSAQWNQVGNIFYLKSTQITSFSSVTPLFITDIDYRISRTSMPDTIIRVLHGQTTENYNFTINGTITGISIDPNNWVLNKVGSITKDISLSISDNSQNEEAFIFIGPNPTSDVLNVYLYNKQDAVLELTNIHGKLIQSVNFTAHYEYDLSHSANGIYMATVKNKSGKVIQSTKVIKN